MSKVTDWIRRHQVAAFFIITFTITWGLGFSYGAVMKRGQYLLAPLAFTATCGPALAGIIISAVTNTQPKQGPSKSFRIAFFVAWIVSTIVCVSHNIFIDGLPLTLLPVLIGLSSFSVIPVAFVLGLTYSRIPAVRSYLSSLIKLRGVWGWSLLALVMIPVLVLVSVPIDSFLSKQPIAAYQLPKLNLSLVGLILVTFLYQLFFFNATGEEVGWRGFALPRLQARTSPLVAALVIAIFWAPWHFFLWQAEGKPVLTVQYWIVMYAGHILFSVLIVWITNRARGSILVAGITHAATNTVQAFIPIRNFAVILLTWSVAALVLILVDRMWEKLPPDHPAVYQAPERDEQNVELPQYRMGQYHEQAL